MANNKNNMEKIKAIANPIRIEIVKLLNDKSESNVSEIMEHTETEQASVSQHLNKMKNAGILSQRKEKQKIFYHIDKSSEQFVSKIIEATNL